MKRIFYFIVFALVSTFVFVSCKSAEQKKAEEYLQNQMKSPSSFKVISCELDLLEAYSTFDTIYHVKKIKGTKSSFSDVPPAYGDASPSQAQRGGSAQPGRAALVLCGTGTRASAPEATTSSERVAAR